MKKLERRTFRLNRRGMMLALVSLTFAQSTLANTGRVDFTTGSVNLTSAGGQVRALAKGAEVRSGDKIVSGVDGRAQIRFSDGAYVSLQPNSEFDIKEYRFDGKTDGNESAVFGLFKGALRTVTGLVGRVNRNKYQITTPTATIGIRGTGGLVQVGADGSTLVTGTSGIWSLTNNRGSLDIPAGTSGFAAANQNVPPQKTSDSPTIPPPPPAITQTQTTFVQGDTRNAQGDPASLPAVLTSGPGYAIAFDNIGLSSQSHLGAPTDAVFNSTGQLTEFTTPVFTPFGSIPTTGTAPITYTLLGTHADFATDGVLAWGRWIGDVMVTNAASQSTVTFNDNQGVHYVIGTPTPFASLPTSGTFTYNLIGATRPTFANGLTAPGTLDQALLKGNFTTGTVDIMLSATAGGGKFDGTTVASIGNLNGAAAFAGTGSATGTGCNTSCFLIVNGIFAGTAATHAGITYELQGTAQGSNLTGAAAFKK